MDPQKFREYRNRFVYNSPRLLCSEAIEIISKHGSPISSAEYSRNGLSFGTFFKLKKDLKGFKCTFGNPGTFTRRIVNLIIPKGAVVFIGKSGGTKHFYKCRADKVIVDSIHSAYDGSKAKCSYSMRTRYVNGRRMATKYQTGKTLVEPNFSKYASTCAPGLHFFLDIKTAFEYDFT